MRAGAELPAPLACLPQAGRLLARVADLVLEGSAVTAADLMKHHHRDAVAVVGGAGEFQDH